MQITLLGTEHDVEIPKTFADKREILFCFWENRIRGSAAALGMSVPSLGFAGRYREHACDAFRFGGFVWEQLSQQGASEAEMVTAALPIVAAIAEQQFPSDAEVSEKKGD